MAQYIDKSAVVEEIEKRTKILDLDNPLGRGGMVELICLKDKIDTLEVKEMSNIWHTISDRDVDLPKAGDIICFVKNGRVISGEYRSNKFYGKVNNGYDNSIEKGDKWCLLSDILSSVVEVKDVDLDKEIEECLKQYHMLAIGKKDFTAIAKHFFELGLKNTERCKEERVADDNH
jgi:hypothetical protein